MTPKVVVAGVASFYLTVDIGGFPINYTPLAKPRWAAAGVSGAGVHLARVFRALGDEVRLCTAVSDDPAGAVIRADLAELGLAGPELVTVERSSLGVVLTDGAGRRMGLPYLAPVARAEYPVGLLTEQARDADLLVLTNAAFVRPLVGPARQFGIPIAVDVHLVADLDGEYNRPWLEAATIVFASHEQLPERPVRWAAEVFGRFPRCQVVGVGCGADGALVGLRDGRLVEVAAVAPWGVVNTSGAGDALFGTFLHGWLRTRDPVHALQTAVVHAAWKIAHRTPAGVTLTVPELTRHLGHHPPPTRLGRWSPAA